jgi:hypothetical protein
MGPVKNLFNPHQPHLEIWKDLTTNYCNKPDTRSGWSYTRGTLRKQGQRTDLIEAASIAVTRGIRAVHEEMPATAIQFHKGLCTHVVMMDTGKKYFPCEVIVHYGKSRTGKTRDIPDGAGKIRIDSDGKAWFDDCIDREIVYIDEFYGNIKVSEFLQITDNYAHPMRIMGAFYPRKYHTMYITSNVHPDQWYNNVHVDQQEAVLNRLKIVQYPIDRSGHPVLPSTSDTSDTIRGITLDPEVPPMRSHTQDSDDEFCLCINKRRPKTKT